MLQQDTYDFRVISRSCQMKCPLVIPPSSLLRYSSAPLYCLFDERYMATLRSPLESGISSIILIQAECVMAFSV